MSQMEATGDVTATEDKKKKKKRFKIAGMKINALRSMAKHLGLGGKGKKKDLIERIDNADVDITEVTTLSEFAEMDSPEKNRYIRVGGI